MSPIEKAKKDREELAKEYNIPITRIVWIGNNKYIIVLQNCETIRI